MAYFDKDAASPNGKGSILLFGHDEPMLSMRAWVLRDAGFAVHAILCLDGAVALLRVRPIDLMLLCHDAAEEECELLVECGWEQGALMDSGATGTTAVRYVLLGCEGRDGDEGWYERLYGMVVAVKELMRVGALVH